MKDESGAIATSRPRGGSAPLMAAVRRGRSRWVGVVVAVVVAVLVGALMFAGTAVWVQRVRTGGAGAGCAISAK